MINPEEFRRDYQAQVMDFGEPDVIFGHEVASTRSMLVDVVPSPGTAWIGKFVAPYPVSRAAHGLFGTPSRTRMCVVCAGTAYVGDVCTRDFRVINLPEEVATVVELPSVGLLLLASRWTVSAMDRSPLLWTTDRLSIEHLRLDAVQGSYLYGVADPEDQTAREFRIDLQAGAVSVDP